MEVDYEGRLAEAYDRGRRLLPEAEEAWLRAVEPYFRPARRVIDVGSGTGRFATLFAGHFGTCVVGVEPAGAMRSQAGPGASWVAGRAEALPFREATADAAWLSCVAHYLDLPAAGQELARVVAPGGVVLVRSAFPDQLDDLEWLRWFPSARALDEARMPALERIASAWAPFGLTLESRTVVPHLVARDLADLAKRLRQRAISTLELISDEEFEAGLAAVDAAAVTGPPAPVYSGMSLVAFRR